MDDKEEEIARLNAIIDEMKIEARMWEKTQLPVDIVRAFLDYDLMCQVDASGHRIMIAKNHVISVLRGHIPTKNVAEEE